MQPIVSVVTATYNYGHFLGDAVDSVRAQTLGDFELIVVDDGSTDNTPDVIKPYLTDSRIEYHRVGHVGVTKAKNFGIRRARGRFVAFLDSDDAWLPGKLERQVEVLDSAPGVGAVYTRRFYFDCKGNSLGIDDRPFYRGNIVEQLFLDNFICYSTVMVRRAVLDEVGIMDEAIFHPSDYDLWLRIALRYRFEYIDEPLVRYRSHPGISRASRAVDRRPEVDFVTNRFLNQYGGRSVIRPDVLQLAEIERCCSIGWAYRDTSTARAAWWYLQALLKSPFFGPAWRGLATIWWPDAWRDRVRRFLGRPDWRVRKLNV